jgi:hypothetical protein
VTWTPGKHSVFLIPTLRCHFVVVDEWMGSLSPSGNTVNFDVSSE